MKNRSKRQSLKFGYETALSGLIGASQLGSLKAVGAQPLQVSALPKTDRVAAHLLNRLGFGPRPGDLERVTANPGEWIEQQLSPALLKLPAAFLAKLPQATFAQTHPTALIKEFRDIQRTNNNAQAQMVADSPKATPNDNNTLQNELTKFVASVARPAVETRLLNALESPKQLQEVMVDFWFNHFNIFQGKNLLRVMAGHYEHFAIRPFAMGKFSDLLHATARHPAMLYYLDNAQSVANNLGGGTNVRGLNENYARELMELHTLGVDGGYTQKDVTELARMLTGWTIEPANRMTATSTIDVPLVAGNPKQMPGFWFNERVHDKGEKLWLGNAIRAQGQAEGDFALDYLAKHPATAKHICFKLAQYFVSDTPRASLVNQLAKVFSDHDGAIIPVLQAIVYSEEFWSDANYQRKFKSPYHYVLSVMRALGSSPENLQNIAGALASQGMPLYGCPTPDGYKNTEVAWLSPDAMTKRINFATSVSANRMNARVSMQDLITTLGPLANESTKQVARELTNDRSSGTGISLALLLAGPVMMRR
jgi:uncharacterized protein (DUF1800 family)